MAQGRVNYTNGVNTIAVADPDAMGGLCCQLLNPDFFDASLSTPAIYLNGVVENTATISFDSSWLNDEIVHPHHDQTSTSHTQTSELQVEFFDANGNLLSVSAKYRSNQTVVVDNEPIPAVVDLERIPAVVDLRNGDTVWVAPGHTAGGEIDQVFRYVGADTSART